jgi:hypothetical protein
LEGGVQMSGKKFKYHVEETWNAPGHPMLDKLGNVGWELVTILREKHNGSFLYTSYFKLEV